MSNIERYNEIVSSLKNKTVIVIGDLMLDRYFWGKVERISPEAPVPVVAVDQETDHLGGAANVANNIVHLGATPIVIGVVGDDNDGKSIISTMRARQFSADGVIATNDRPTTVKLRIIAENQHVVRVDKESAHPVNEDIQEQILKYFKSKVGNADALIIEDYNKGVLSEKLITEIITIAKAHNLIITVDPKFENFFTYKGVTVFKPNRAETERILGVKLTSIQDQSSASKQLLEKLECDYVLLTLGEAGMTLYSHQGVVCTVPARVRDMHDGSGAGDTVISILTLALAAGANGQEATELANYAAGVVCGKVGVQPITISDLMESINYYCR